jgi:hypothetical protein
MHIARNLSWRALGLSLLMLTGSTGTARGQANLPPLTAADQDRINKAIDNGVQYLRGSQGADGTWGGPMDRYKIGYTAMPGLTLLECGVPADDPVIVKAAKLVRWRAPQLEDTYELALSILFLDRLGNAKDRGLIRSMALRLIAGQTTTGGWSYKCPRLGTLEPQLLNVLRQLDPDDIYRPVSPGDTIAYRPDPVVPKVGEKLEPGIGRAREPREAIIPTDTARAASTDPTSTEDSRQRQAAYDRASARQAGANKDRPPAMPDPGDKPAKPDPAKPKQPTKVVIPPGLRGLPVLQDLGNGMLADPPNKGNDPLGTTDNSNTQFAMLAIWAARRHEIPTRRTLTLIARRFNTSQMKDGNWSYHYRNGGDPTDQRSPAMTCVGLLGLAIAHGLARDQADGNPPPQAALGPGQGPPPDQGIVDGLLALQGQIGNPTGRMDNVPANNLYFLWSVERVAVLYSLKVIGQKDWYRWGAEILVANQNAAGNWDSGGYHAASPTINTCLALLFLKRVNLTRDLQGKLAFKTEDLSDLLIAKTAPKKTEDPKPPPEEPSVSEPKPVETPAPEPEKPAPVVATPPPAPAVAEEEPARPAGGRRMMLWILLGLLALVVIGGGVVVLVVYGRESEEVKKPVRRPAKLRKSKAGKHKPKAAH